MTTSDHRRVLGILHLIYGTVAALAILAGGVVIIASVGVTVALRYLLPASGGSWFAGSVLVLEIVLTLLIMLLTAVLALPSLLTGYALLKGKSWARGSAFVALVVLFLTAPVGTLINLLFIGYTLWFLFGGGMRSKEIAAAP